MLVVSKKAEALKRMKVLGLDDSLISEFNDDDTVYQSVRLNRVLDAVLQLPDEETRQMIHDFENTNHCVVYHCQKTNTEVGVLYSLLFVSDDSDMWDSELSKEGDTYYAYAFVKNLSEPSFSEFGDIGVKPSMGGITRVA